MKIGIGRFLKDGLTREGIESAFRRVTAAVTAGFAREHNDDGTHKAVTVEGLTVADNTAAAGVVGSNLVPATNNTYDIGRQSTEPTSPFYAWRNLYIANGVLWCGSDTTALGAFTTSWGMTRSGSNLVLNTNVSAATFSVKAVSTDRAIFNDDVVIRGSVAKGVTISRLAVADVQASASVGTPFLALTDGIAAPSAQAGWAKIYVDTADGDLKVIFGDGVVKTIVVDT